MLRCSVVREDACMFRVSRFCLAKVISTCVGYGFPLPPIRGQRNRWAWSETAPVLLSSLEAVREVKKGGWPSATYAWLPHHHRQVLDNSPPPHPHIQYSHKYHHTFELLLHKLFHPHREHPPHHKHHLISVMNLGSQFTSSQLLTRINKLMKKLKDGGRDKRENMAWKLHPHLHGHVFPLRF